MHSSRSFSFWSAVPTPLTPHFTVDVSSVEKMVEASIADGITGLFLAGTCGEGPWLPNRERIRLVKAAAQAAGGRIRIAAQVSDNSVPRILDNMQDMAAAGAEVAIVAAPAVMFNPTPDRIAAHFEEAISASPLPVGVYDLGGRRPFAIPADRLKHIYSLPNVQLVKDSSADRDRRAIALAARAENPALQLFNGDEFLCLEYLEAGYDGCMFGGAVAVAREMRTIAELFAAGRIEEARVADEQMRTRLYGIYGGTAIACWLTGLKYYMVRRGLFASTTSFLGYPLSAECRAFIERDTAEKLAV